MGALAGVRGNRVLSDQFGSKGVACTFRCRAQPDQEPGRDWSARGR